MNSSDPSALLAVSLSNGAPAQSPCALYALAHLSDAELLAGTCGLVARSNQQLAALLAHLAEVEVRGIHRERACASLYTYCMYELRFPEDKAFRYARVAKLAWQFPVLFEQIAAGEIHLSGVLVLAPHLTEENHRELLRSAKHRTKREIVKLVRMLDPQPDVPPLIEPLGPAPSGHAQTNATWQAFVGSLNPVRELEPGRRPRDWLGLGAGAESGGVEQPAESQPSFGPQRYKIQFTANQEYVDLVERARDLRSHVDPSRSLDAVHLEAMRVLVAALEKRKYGVTQSSRSQGNSEPPGGESAHESAAAATKGTLTRVDETTECKPIRDRPDSVALERSNATGTGDREGPVENGMPEKPRRRGNPPDRAAPEHNDAISTGDREGPVENPTPAKPRQCGNRADRAAPERNDAISTDDREGPVENVKPAKPRRRGNGADGAARERNDVVSADDRARPVESSTPAKPRRRGRYIPVAVRRQVRERDGGCCAYVDADGRRCCETRWIEVHHLEPYGRGGPAVVENLALRCRDYNALAAEEDFGREHMARKTGRD